MAMTAEDQPLRTAGKKTTQRLLTIIVLVAVAVLIYLLRGRIHFDFAAVGHELRAVSWRPIALGFGAIYAGTALRAWRWKILLSPVKETSALELISPQFIGFTMVALFGRVVDLARPWLIARRTETPVATQLAIYSIERAFDLGAAAILFSLALAFAPGSLPHHELFVKAGIAALTGTAGLAVFAVALRFWGEHLARVTSSLLRPFSAELAEKAAARVLDFREGMKSLRSISELVAVLALSLVIWAGIAAAYFESSHAFQNTPELAALSVTGALMIMAAAMGGSLLQLPVIGWFTQITVIALALHEVTGVRAETATACATLNTFMTTLGVVPAGLLAARLQGVGLRDAARGVSSASAVAPLKTS